MSRSWKHTPYCGDRKNRFAKRAANKRLRAQKLVHNLQHKQYRKLTESYGIRDYYSIETHNFALYYQKEVNRWYRWRSFGWNDEPYPDYAKCLNDYKKWYIRK